MNEQEKLSGIIGLIYDAAQDPLLWPALLHELDHIGNNNALSAEHHTGLEIEKRQPRFDFLKSHFERAFNLNRKIFELESERDAISSILDRLPIGVLIIDDKKFPIAINQHAQNIIRAGNTLLIQNGELITKSAQDNQQLNIMIKNALAQKESAKEHISNQTLTLNSDKGTFCSLWVSPSSRIGIGQGLVAIFIASSDIQQAISTESIIKMYTLTSAEGRLLSKIMNGSNSLNEAATELKVSKHTVRSQMKSILTKTNTHSQTELVKKVLHNPAALIGKQQSTKLISNLKALDLKPLHHPDNSNGSLKLNDGRTMEYHEFGDLSGTPVLFFHGIVHSKNMFHPSSHYAEENGIRIIAPERPGFGNSDFQKERSLTAYTKDIKQLLDHLGITSFYVAGDGDGCPAALATACIFKQEVLKVTIMGCMPEPRFEALELILPFDLKLQKMAKSMPRIILYSLCKIILKGVKVKNSYFELMYQDFPDTDQAVVKSSGHRQLFSDAMGNITNKNIDGFIDDYFCRLYPWDIAIEDIIAPVEMWHGVNDPFSNIVSAKKICASLSNCHTHFLEDQGHYLFITHWDEILESLVSSNVSDTNHVII